ncbi:MAG: hypothetical protein KDB00_24205 [Planctomycetales bacterium]|nr:hypothetical protein [Planctomycetales bacterium]
MYQSLYENEALKHVVADGARRVGMHLDVVPFLDSLAMESIHALHEQFLQVLEHDDLSDFVERKRNQSPPDPDAGYGMRLRAEYQDGAPVAMTFYRVKDSWQANCLSLTGLALALASYSPNAMVPAASLVLNTWKNLINLRRPDDAAQLDAYEAMLKAKAALVQKSDKRDPSVREILASSNDLNTASLDEMIDGLNRLRLQGLSEVSDWGCASMDYENPENRWRPRW